MYTIALSNLAWRVTRYAKLIILFLTGVPVVIAAMARLGTLDYGRATLWALAYYGFRGEGLSKRHARTLANLTTHPYLAAVQHELSTPSV